MKEWSQALRELELLAPLLTLCCGVWKADKTLGCILDGKAVPQEVSRPPSRASSISSSISHATSFSCAPSRISAPGAPPSSSLGSSSHPPSSAASHSCPSQPSPRHVTLNKSSWRSHPNSEAAEPAATTKAAASKGKRRREPSPRPVEKRTKAGGDDASDLGKYMFFYTYMQLTTCRCRKTSTPFPPPSIPFDGEVWGSGKLFFTTLGSTSDPPPPLYHSQASQPKRGPVAASTECATSMPRAKSSRGKAALTRRTGADRPSTPPDEQEVSTSTPSPAAKDTTSELEVSKLLAMAGLMLTLVYYRGQATTTYGWSGSSETSSSSGSMVTTSSHWASGQAKKVSEVLDCRYVITDIVSQILSRPSRRQRSRSSPPRRSS